MLLRCMQMPLDEGYTSQISGYGHSTSSLLRQCLIPPPSQNWNGRLQHGREARWLCDCCHFPQALRRRVDSRWIRQPQSGGPRALVRSRLLRFGCALLMFGNHRAHLDIAGVMDLGKGDGGYNLAGMTGRPVRTLIEFARRSAKA